MRREELEDDIELVIVGRAETGGELQASAFVPAKLNINESGRRHCSGHAPALLLDGEHPLLECVTLLLPVLICEPIALVWWWHWWSACVGRVGRRAPCVDVVGQHSFSTLLQIWQKALLM